MLKRHDHPILGYLYVNLLKAADVDRAAQATDGSYIRGLKVQVQISKSR